MQLMQGRGIGRVENEAVYRRRFGLAEDHDVMEASLAPQIDGFAVRATGRRLQMRS